MDVYVSIAHCKKVVFTFLPFTFLPFSISFSYTHAQYPLQVLFQLVRGRAIFLIDSFFRWIFDTDVKEKAYICGINDYR